MSTSKGQVDGPTQTDRSGAAIWLALVSCLVALYNARHDRAGTRFDLINPETGNRIRMITQDAETAKEVEHRDFVKATSSERTKCSASDSVAGRLRNALASRSDKLPGVTPSALAAPKTALAHRNTISASAAALGAAELQIM